MTFRRLLANDRASSSAEFALVVPLLLLLLFGIVDVGRYLWTLNQIEKATQMGVRYAVVSDPVATVIDNDFVDNGGIPGGDPVPLDKFSKAVCTSTICTGTGSVSGVSGRNATAFNNIVLWMQRYYPPLVASNVSVTYQNVGLGYSGDPVGPDVSPLVTISVAQLPFNPILLFGTNVRTPVIKASLTMEDGECSTDCGSSN